MSRRRALDPHAAARVGDLRPRTPSPRSIAPPRPASTTSAASAPSASCRISTTCCSSAPRSAAIRSKAIARSAAPTSCSARASPRSRSTLKIPITIAGMSFGSLSAPGQGSAGPRRLGGRHLDHHRRRRHDGGGARAHSKLLVYQVLPSRYGMEPGPVAQGRRHRDRGRPGRQARRRRHAARPEDLRARRRRCARCRRASTSARPAAIPTGPARTISRSRSTSCARSPTGRSRSTSRSAPRGPTTTRRSP